MDLTPQPLNGERPAQTPAPAPDPAGTAVPESAAPSPFPGAPSPHPGAVQPGAPGAYPGMPGAYPGYPGAPGPGAPAPYPPYPNPPVYPPQPGYWTPLPEAPRIEAPSKRPWPAPGHSRLHAKDRPRERRWWTPLLTTLLAVALFGSVSMIAGIVLGVWIAIQGGGMEDVIAITGGADADLSNPLFYVFTFGSIALMIPAFAIAMRVVEGVRLGALSSIDGRLRWGILARAAGLAVLVLSPTIILSIGDTVAAGGISAERLATGAALLPLVLVLVPIQSAAEEYAFRGFALRTLMGWGLAPIIAMIIAVVPFTLGHIYGWKGMLDVTVFGLCMAWLVWRTGGLEASIALHAVNNLTGAVFSAFGQGNLLDDNIPVWALALSLVQTLVYTAIADRLWAAKKDRALETAPEAGAPGVGAPGLGASEASPTAGHEPDSGESVSAPLG